MPSLWSTPHSSLHVDFPLGTASYSSSDASPIQRSAENDQAHYRLFSPSSPNERWAAQNWSFTANHTTMLEICAGAFSVDRASGRRFEDPPFRRFVFGRGFFSTPAKPPATGSSSFIPEYGTHPYLNTHARTQTPLHTQCDRLFKLRYKI